MKEIIKSDPFLREGERQLASMSDKKDTLRHSRRMANLGWLLAGKLEYSPEETRFFVEACIFHDIGKTEIAAKYITRLSKRFTEKDLRAIKKHAYRGYKMLKEAGRSPRVYFPVLLHHEFQERPYPEIGGALIQKLGEVEDIDIDNAQYLAMIDVFDTLAFGREYVGIKPHSLEEARRELNRLFHSAGDAERIDFLISSCEKIKELE